jgi:hypothetical protein
VNKTGRFILTFPHQQQEILKRIAYIDDSSVAEVVRKAVALYITERKKTIGEKELIKEFWSQAQRAENKCLEWQGTLSDQGYGVNSRELMGEIAAHRVAYRIIKGEIPEKLFVCHTCDNPRCVDPDHLFLGTAKDNYIDMVSKGRRKNGVRTLNGELAAQIIRLYYGGHRLRLKHLAAKFEVNISTISNVLTRKTFSKDAQVIKEWELVDKKRNERI